MTAAAGWWRTRDPVLLALAVFLLSSPITAPMISRRAYDDMFERQRLGAGDTRVDTDDHHLSAAGPTGEFKFAWSDFRKIDVTPEHVLLWVHDYLCVIVPVRGLDVAQAQSFVDLVRRRTTPAIR
jgi:hypothetical protein